MGTAAVGVPALQHVADAGIGEVGVVRGVRPVHGGDLGHDLRPHVVVVVGGDADRAGALDQPGRVPDEGEAHLRGLERGRPVVGGLDQARGLRHREAAIGHLRRTPPPGRAMPLAPSEHGNRQTRGDHTGLPSGNAGRANDRARDAARHRGRRRHGNVKSTGSRRACCSHAHQVGCGHRQQEQARIEKRAAHQARPDPQLVGLLPQREARPEAGTRAE